MNNQQNKQQNNQISNAVEGIKINVLSSKVVESPFFTSTFSISYKCRKYYVKLSYNGNKYTFTYHDSVHNYQHNNELNKKDVLYCVLSDMNCYESSIDKQDFLDQFGYTDNNIKQGIKAYKGCKKASEKLHTIFTDSELEALQEEFQEY